MHKTVKARKALDIYYMGLEIWVRARHCCPTLYRVGLRSLAQLGLQVESWGHLTWRGKMSPGMLSWVLAATLVVC